MSSPVINVENLIKRFDGVAAVDDVSFQVGRGETVALLGANGAGKTTTISMLLGLLLPSSGRIEILGADMTRRPSGVLQRINFSSPYVDLPRRLTVQQNLVFFARLYGVTDVKARLAELARDLDLEALWSKRTGQLSAGQKTRVSLAKALINRPQVLLLDEPTASLDPDTADWLRGYLERYQAVTGATILLASHNMAEVERLAHRVLMMRAGKIADEGTPEHLIQRYGRATLEEVFLDIARRGVRPNAGEAA
ncbi:ABC transporter ATP-binding protein [Algihabitans albus]|uniref:ABC transporter ATP-binding protein n=1 Tax=Algihabitans albus TaxID=2164067 RepID=UPI001F2A3B18|nr:ABC transporter ATP-binding protein [Algihabitans albus]